MSVEITSPDISSPFDERDAQVAKLRKVVSFVDPFRHKRNELKAILALMLGKLQGNLISKLLSKLTEFKLEFKTGCPDAERLESIRKGLTSFQTLLGKILKILDIIDRILTILQVIIIVIRAIITAIIGIVSAIPLLPGIVSETRLNVVGKIKDILDDLDDIILTIKLMIRGSVGSIEVLTNQIKNLMGRIDLGTQLCVLAGINKPIAPTINQYVTEIVDQGIVNPEVNVIINKYEVSYLYGVDKLSSSVEPIVDGIPYVNNIGEKFYLYIVNDITSPAVAPRRYAEARTIRGSIVIQGPKSFSSSTQILLDEIKFRLDNKLA